jgi:hypothetical protein
MKATIDVSELATKIIDATGCTEFAVKPVDPLTHRTPDPALQKAVTTFLTVELRDVLKAA